MKMKLRKIVALVMAISIVALTILSFSSCGKVSLEYRLKDDGTYEVSCLKNTSSKNELKIKIPSKYKGKAVTSIGDEAFNDFNYSGNLVSIVIPDSITSIGNGAFKYCTFADITIPNSVVTIGEEAFKGCSAITSIEIPNSVKSIGERAFSDCVILKSITISENIENIGNGIFANCKDLETITLSEKTTKYKISNNCLIDTQNSILIYGYKDCKIPTDIAIKTIGNGAFSGNNLLLNIVIPSSVTTIEENAFAYCNSLNNVEIPQGVTKIGNGTFMGCNSPKVVISENNTSYKVVGNCIIDIANKTVIAGFANSVIPNDVTAIAPYAFAQCDKLEQIRIPDSVITIGTYAFGHCNSLLGVVIGKGVTDIEPYAFYECHKLQYTMFSNNSGWYVKDSKEATDKTEINVENEFDNAGYLKDTYCNKNWYRK